MDNEANNQQQQINAADFARLMHGLIQLEQHLIRQTNRLNEQRDFVENLGSRNAMPQVALTYILDPLTLIPMYYDSTRVTSAAD